MIAALATIVVLVAAWAAILAIAGSLEQNLGKIGAALRGQAPALQPQLASFRISPRYPQARSQRARARPALRAAA